MPERNRTETEGREGAVPRKLRLAASRLGLSGKGLLLAVSGGPDSMAMLLAMADLRAPLGLRLEVACVDHGLRPGSAGDVRYVARVAARLGLPFHGLRAQVGREGGLEAAARRARYAALERLARERGLDWVATAHTMEDQAETLLLRLARGAGLRGLRGILPKRGAVVRPMLEVTREDVALYLRARRCRPRVDPTNDSGRFARNRVRRRVLPAIRKALGEAAIASMARSASLAAEDERVLARLARRAAERVLSAGAGGFEGDAGLLAGLPLALRRRVLRLAARRLGLRPDLGHVDAMLRAIEAGRPATLRLPMGIDFAVRYGRFSLGPRQKPQVVQPFDHRIPGPGRFEFPQATVEVRLAGPGPSPGLSVRLDPEGARFPLHLRSRLPGDRFRPPGGRSKKLKDLLIDWKVPRELRDHLLLLTDATGDILWVVGLKPSLAAQQAGRAGASLLVSVCPAASEAQDRAL